MAVSAANRIDRRAANTDAAAWPLHKQSMRFVPHRILRGLGLAKDHWTMKVKGVGSSYWRIVGSLEELIEKAKELKRRTLFGIGFERFLKNICSENAGIFLPRLRLVALRWDLENLGEFLDLNYVRKRIN